MPTPSSNPIIEATGLDAFFHDAIHEAAERQQLGADQATLHYVTLLLCDAARSERVFDYVDARMQLRPLALIYGDALAAGSLRERRLWLQRLGDLALLVGGLFAGRLNRHFSDLGYCVAMGGNAYGYLHDSAERDNEHAQAQVFGELAEGFGDFVQVVALVSGRRRETAAGDLTI